MELNKKISLFLFLIFSISLISAATVELGDGFEKNKCIDLTQTCSNCSYVNISFIQYPNSTKINLDESMVQTGVEYSYEFCNTSLLGTYTYGTYGNPDGELDNQNVKFVVTPNGEKPDIAKAIFYISLLAIFLVLIVGDVWLLFNSEDISWKTGYISLFYILFNVFSLVCWKMAEDFLTSIPFMATIFKSIYFITTAGYFPFFIIMFFYLFLHMTQSLTESRLRKRGYSDEQIDWKMKNKRR